MARRCENWVDGFLQLTAKVASPEIFRLWGAIAAVAGALERKVWVNTSSGVTYANLYIVFVAPAAVGKTAVTERVRQFWLELKDQHVASTSVTKAYLMDELLAAERTGVLVPPIDGKGTFQFNSLKILANELGVLIPGYDSDFMNVLTDLWDGHVYSEGRRGTKKVFVIERPQLHMLAATTPSYLNDIMPPGAWAQGFISRVILVYSGEKILAPLFDFIKQDDVLHKNLTADLQHIGRLYGKMTFSQGAADAMTAWHLSGGKPSPDHPRLVEGYNGRRTRQMLKLCMVASIADGDTMEISLEHYNRAMNWLTEAEEYMPDIFKALSNGGDNRVMEETWHFCIQLHLKNPNKPIPENKIIVFLQQRVPAHNVVRILEVMVKAQMLRPVFSTGNGNFYEPVTAL